MTKGDRRFNPFLGLLPLALIALGLFVAERVLTEEKETTMVVRDAHLLQGPLPSYRLTGTTEHGPVTIEAHGEGLEKVSEGSTLPVVIHTGRVFGTKYATLRD